ncbi:hypothetical protein Ciccas_010667 [Cichlidogyrus casuarinus]|uniref:Uncharacterized protein n=1 Tax=Cichlidogyrus casuarinus TaxID=1844966 RepID=A0ABD2PTI4_9PLAT
MINENNINSLTYQNSNGLQINRIQQTDSLLVLNLRDNKLTSLEALTQMPALEYLNIRLDKELYTAEEREEAELVSEQRKAKDIEDEIND